MNKSPGGDKQLICLVFALTLFLFILPYSVASASVSIDSVISNSADELTPVILIPGTSRTKLVRKKDGRVMWGNFRKFLALRDREELALPIESNDLSQNRGDLIPSGLMDKITVVPYVFSVYSHQKFLKRMEKNGYQFGNIDQPKSGDNFFVFLYDWRRSHQENAAELAKTVDRLKAFFHRPDLKFDIIAHCSANYIARYYALYGGENVLNDPDPKPTNAGAQNIRKLILVSPAHRGTMLAFQVLHDGFKPVRPLPFTMYYSPYEAFTAPAFFEMLPPSGEIPFVDEKGNLLDLDLYNPENWVKYGWSVFSEKEQKRLKRCLKREFSASWEEELKKENEKRLRYLKTVLEHTKRFHQALNEEVKIISPSVETYSFIFKGGPTIARAELSGKDHRIRFKKGKSDKALRFSEGDLMITDLSMRGRYREHKPAEIVLTGKHRQMANSSLLHRYLMDLIRH